ncbi:MAG: hypothetical protein WDO73_02210 [Ignavibacteriota bacterium]
MACPYFHAVKPRAQTDSSRSAMLPLGDAWDGVCRAHPESPSNPDETTLQSCCNMGYARGCCPRFPAGDGPDAARLHHRLRHRRNTPRLLRSGARPSPVVAWPAGVFPLRESMDSHGANDATINLAHAYVTSYLRRISEASAG